MEYVKCNLCNSNEYKPFKEINDCQLVKCKRCGLVYMNPRPTQQEINQQYSAEYHIERLLSKEPKTEEEIEQQINKNIGRAEEIAKRFGNKGKLLDIGCSTGFFMVCLKRCGWDISGVDVSNWASKFARDKLGLSVFTGSVEEIEFKDQFDVVTMNHTLEHLSDPFGTLRRVSEILINGGILIIKGPNFASFDRTWHGTNWRGYSDRGHLYYFTPRTYCMALEKAGFCVQKIIFQYWDPVAHFKEIRLGDGIRVDHPPDAITKSAFNDHNNHFLRAAGKALRVTARVLELRGRDLTIYANKEITR